MSQLRKERGKKKGTKKQNFSLQKHISLCIKLINNISFCRFTCKAQNNLQRSLPCCTVPATGEVVNFRIYRYLFKTHWLWIYLFYLLLSKMYFSRYLAGSIFLLHPVYIYIYMIFTYSQLPNPAWSCAKSRLY